MGKESRRVAALILRKVVTMHLALPVDVFIADNLPASLYTCHIPLPTRTVLIKQQLRRPCLTHSIKHLPESVATGKEQQ